MVLFTRKEYVREVRIYDFEITDKYAKNVSEDIKKTYNVDVELTEKDYLDMLEGAENEKLDMVVNRRYTNWNGEEHVYVTTVGDIMHDWLNDDVWDIDPYYGDCETIDVYDDFRVYE